MNKMKDHLIFPECLQICNVTNAYKNKGDRTHFDSYRGLFRTPVFWNILDKLLYFDMYEAIDVSMTDCNVGSRKRRNIRDNLFVINAISNKAKVKKLMKHVIFASMMLRSAMTHCGYTNV